MFSQKHSVKAHAKIINLKFSKKYLYATQICIKLPVLKLRLSQEDCSILIPQHFVILKQFVLKCVILHRVLDFFNYRQLFLKTEINAPLLLL